VQIHLHISIEQGTAPGRMNPALRPQAGKDRRTSPQVQVHLHNYAPEEGINSKLAACRT
jgi:hypothetical protein